MTNVFSNERGLVYLPAGFSDPTTPAEALRAAKAVLEEEGRWCKGDELDASALPSDAAPERATTPYCGSWQACAVGAVGTVTTGAYKPDGLSSWYIFVPPSDNKWRMLYIHAVDALDKATQQVTGQESVYDSSEELDTYVEDDDGYFDSVVEKNDYDTTTRDDILHIFDVAIANVENAGERDDSNNE